MVVFCGIGVKKREREGDKDNLRRRFFGEGICWGGFWKNRGFGLEDFKEFVFSLVILYFFFVLLDIRKGILW